jgi:tetratricopeptide (TPR) repeat protein
MMFVYPSMVALAAMALSGIMKIGHQKWIRYTVILVIAAGIIHPLRHIIKNHPNTYIYFNEWSGGINKTYGKFETDYYCNSLGPASDYFIKHILPTAGADREQPVRIVSNASISYYFRNYTQQVVPFYSRYYDRGKEDWDYAILYCNYIHPYQLNNGLWPPVNTVHEIKVDDVVVAAIIERRNRDDYLGSRLLDEGVKEEDGAKVDQAVKYLESALEYNKNNESALLEIGNAYSVTFRFDDARAAMDRLLKIYPDYDKAYNLKGYSYMIESEVRRDPALLDEAIRYINRAIQSNYKFYSGYYNLGLCYGMKNDRGNAEYNLKMAIRYNSRFMAAYEKLAELYEYYGENELANAVRAQISRLR